MLLLFPRFCAYFHFKLYGFLVRVQKYFCTRAQGTHPYVQKLSCVHLYVLFKNCLVFIFMFVLSFKENNNV